MEVSEGAPHRVDGNPLEVVQSPAECVGTLGEFTRQLLVSFGTKKAGSIPVTRSIFLATE
jgi:hypothetical protein